MKQYFYSVLFLFKIIVGSFVLPVLVPQLSSHLYPQGFTEVFAGSLTGVVNGSVQWGDYDNDGDLDILLTGNPSSGSISKIYQNTGSNFIEVYVGSLASVGSGSSATWGDYDNDGDLDILLTGYSYPDYFSKIYQNTGSDFIEVFAGSLEAVRYSSTAWGDYDNDGDLDILLTGRDDSFNDISKIYQNTGSGFTEVFPGSLVGVIWGSTAWGDYDNDGDLDILLTGLNGSNTVSKIYQNTGSSFIEVYGGSLSGVYAGSAAWGDYDNDGDLDILSTGYTSSGSGYLSKIYQNTGSGFTEVYAGSLTTVHSSSAVWGDYDNDGKLDILLTGQSATSLVSKIYRNTGSGFTEVYSGSLIGVHSSSVSWGDYDNEGDLDILLTGGNGNFISRIYRNDGTSFNTLPATPSGLTASVNGTSATVQWVKATDAQTPQNGLSYNLRIGTNPGGINTQSPMANLSNGYRRVVQLGNVNQNTGWTVKNLPDGTYYWSVQAIDNAYAGSQFASEETFTIGAQPLSIENTSPMDIAGCGGVGTLEPDSTISPTSHFGIPSEFVLHGEPNAEVMVTFTLPANLVCPDGDIISVSFSSTSGKNQTTGSLFNPTIPNTFILDSSGQLRFTLGISFDAGSGCSCPEFNGQLQTFVEYAGGFSKISRKTINGVSTESEITFTCTSCGNCLPPPEGMVAWWSGDTTATDFSDENNDGTIYGVTYTSGKISVAYTFDGVNDYIEIPDSPSLNFGTGDFSFDAWVKTTSTSGVFVIQDKRAVSGGAGYHVHLYNGGPSIQIADAGGVSTWNSNYSIADGLWHHVAITVERASSTGLKFYVDGSLVSTKDPSARNGSVSNNSVLRIGSRSFSLSGFFNGSLDEMEFFNRALTDVEVYSLFVADSVGKCKQATPIASDGGVEGVRCDRYAVSFDPLGGSGSVFPNNNGESLTGDVGVDISGSVGANVQVTATFPSTMTGTCGTTATISFPSYGIYSGFHLETNSYFDPHIANTFTLNSIGVATLRLGYAFVIPAAASFLGETFTAQVTFTVDGISTISTITITASPGGCGTCIKPPQGMVAWWSGDGNADDISDGTNDGILRNGVTYSSGKVSQTFTFDGVDDYVEIPNHSSLNFGTGDFSFDAWVQTTDAAGVDVIQDKREGGSVGDPGYHVHLYNGTPSILIGDATDYSTFISGVSVADGNWHHIAITVERANPAGLKFYIDGALVSTKNPTARNGSVSNNAVFTIGSRSFQNSGNFNGSIDEVEVFNRALTACQVNALYLADTLGKCKPSSGTSVAGGKVTLESGLLSLSAFQKNSPSMPFKQGDPIRDVEVSLGKKPSGTVMFTQSDDSGKFFFMGLEPGEYELKVTPPAGAVVAYPPEGTYTFTLSEGDTISDFEFRLMLTPPDSYWRIIPSGTTVNLNAVGFFDENIAVAVGDSNTILRSTDGGVTWNPAEIDTVAGVSKLFRGGGDPMKGLNISKPSGGGGTVGPCGKKAICVGGGGKILETTDFGQSWHFMNSGTLSTLHGITSVSITNFVAVGENLTMLYSSNSGDSWLPSTIISPPQISSKMMGNTVKNTFDGNRYYCDTCCPHMSKQLTNPFEANLIAVGESGLIFTSSDMGVTWMYQTPFTSQSLNSGVGFPGNHSFVAGDALFLQSTDNGFSWSVTTDTEETIRSVISVGSSSAYAVGDNGRIIFSSDQGTSWSTEVSPSTNDLLGVASEDFSDGFARIVLAVGEGGLIMRKIEQIGEAVNIPTEDGWNLVSVPVEPAEYATDTLFRFAASSAFSYDNGYVSEDSLTPGKGYWLKFNGTSAAGMIGSSITAETVDVKARWNLVGSITEEISTSFVTSIPPGLVTSNFFGYSNAGYTFSPVITPGKGYWVKVNGDGKLILSSGTTLASNRIKIVPTSEKPPSPPGEESNSKNPIIPSEFALEQNYPNPFNPFTVINYQLPVNSYVSVKIYSVLGQEIATLVDEMQDAGYKSATFDGSNIPSGIYFFQIRTETWRDTKKLLLMK